MPPTTSAMAKNARGTNSGSSKIVAAAKRGDQLGRGMSASFQGFSKIPTSRLVQQFSRFLDCPLKQQSMRAVTIHQAMCTCQAPTGLPCACVCLGAVSQGVQVIFSDH